MVSVNIIDLLQTRHKGEDMTGTIMNNTLRHYCDNFSFTKAAACLPFIGPFIGMFEQQNLVRQIVSAWGDKDTVIELIKTKNDYKMAFILSQMITTVLTVCSYIAGILPALAALGMSLMLIGFSGLVGNQIIENARTIDYVNNNGLVFSVV